MSRVWIAPLMVFGVLSALLGFLFIGGPTTALFGGLHAIIGVAAVVWAIIIWRSNPAKGSRPWLPWTAVIVFGGFSLFISRTINIAALDAGITLPSGLEAQAKAEVSAIMRDPTSPIFTNVKATSLQVCGNVNGKNAYGAYAGASRFVWTSATGPEIEGSRATSGFENVDSMRACFFEQEWRDCQGLPPTAEDCTRHAVPSS